MRALAETHPDRAFVQQVVARLPWGHVVRLMENVKDATRREWYARQSIEHGWSRNVLIHQIESNLYERQGKTLTNFSRTLPAVLRFRADKPVMSGKSRRKSAESRSITREPQPSRACRSMISRPIPQLSRCTKLGDLENNEWIVALKWETQHRNCI